MPYPKLKGVKKSKLSAKFSRKWRNKIHSSRYHVSSICKKLQTHIILKICVVLFSNLLLILKSVICNQNSNISRKLWQIFKILDILKLYTEPGFWNAPWFSSLMLSEMRNYQTKSVTLNLGHPVYSPPSYSQRHSLV